MVEMGVTTEDIKVALFILAPLGDDVTGANAKAAAAVNDNVVAIRRLDPKTGGPAAIDALLCNFELVSVRGQGFAIERTANDVFNAAIDRTGFALGLHLLEHLFE